MEVSNSTEQSTDYRVGANGGGTPMAPLIQKAGTLEPGERIDLKLKCNGSSWMAVFSINGKQIASGTGPKHATTVELRGKPGDYTLEFS